MSCSRSASPRSVCAPQVVLSGFQIGIEQPEQRPLTPSTVRKSTSLLSLQFSSPGVKDCSEDWSSDSQEEYYSDVDSEDEEQDRGVCLFHSDASASTRSCAEQGLWHALGFTRHKHQFSNTEARLLGAFGPAAPEEFKLTFLMGLESTRTYSEAPADHLLSTDGRALHRSGCQLWTST